MAVSISEICENSKLAREMALMGNYDSAVVYYQGVVQEIQKLLHSIDDPSRKEKWQSVYIIFINRKILKNNLNIQPLTNRDVFSKGQIKKKKVTNNS